MGRYSAMRAAGVLLAWAPLSVSTAYGSTHATDWNYMANTRIVWKRFDAEAFEIARAADRPLFVFIYADWCKWCEKYEKETLETDRIRARLERDFVPVAVDYDRERALARRVGTRLVPTSLLLAPDGQKLLRFYGFIGPEDLDETLAQVLEQWRRGELPEPDFAEADFGDEQTCCPLQDMVPAPEG